MRAPLSWIRDFTPVEATVGDIADALNQLGLEVEAIDEPGREIGGVVAAKIIEVLPHPGADRIRLADVDAGDGPVRVVCGAPNIAAGMVVPFAQVGAYLPGDFKIERRKIRGEVSEGMLCSARRARARRQSRGDPRAAARRRRWVPTCARFSASTMSCSTCRSRRIDPTRWASSAWPASWPPTSRCRSTCRHPTPVRSCPSCAARPSSSTRPIAALDLSRWSPA